MGIWSRLFSRKDPEDYEQILSSLALDINKRQSRLAEIRLRERRTTLLVTLYAIAAWGVYVALWYGGFVHIGGGHGQRVLWKFLQLAPVIVGPVLIQFTRRIVQAWYTRIGNAEEATLKQLHAQQRAKIEEIKQKTNFYSTKNLIERYDSNSAGHGPAGLPRPTHVALLKKQEQPFGAGTVSGPQGQPPVTPQRVGPRQSNVGVKVPVTPANGGPVPGELAFSRMSSFRVPLNSHTALDFDVPRTNFIVAAHHPTSLSPFSSPMQPQLSLLQPNTQPNQLQFHYPPRKQWYDRLADALLGDDEVSSGGGRGEMSKYALVCVKCHAHNGLVKEELWEDMQYTCPKCGHFNPSYRMRKNAQGRTSPPLGNLHGSPTLSTPPSSPPAGDRLSSPLAPVADGFSSPLSSPKQHRVIISDEEEEDAGGGEQDGLDIVDADLSQESVNVGTDRS